MGVTDLNVIQLRNEYKIITKSFNELIFGSDVNGNITISKNPR
jgi:hypothetical protein